MHKSSPLLLALLLSSVSTIVIAPAHARDDIMPPPVRAPRTAVEREKLASANAANESPATMMGTAQARDGATLRLHDSARDVTARLIGVVAPPLTTPEGVAARSALDGILKNQTLDCARRDRDRDGSLVMSCSFGGGRDLSEAILFTGTALFSRTTTVDSDLAVRYRAAEETAQVKRAGLWAAVPASAAAAPAATAATKPVTPAATPIISLAGAPSPAQDNNPTTKNTAATADDGGFATMAWLEALGLLGALFGMLLFLDQRHTRRSRLTHELDTRSNRQILAAALAGELAAARDICEARAALVTAGGEPRWPRLRTYVYQAHAEQIGLLGAVLARQVASIYGQMADYGATNRGATYGSESDLTTPASLSRALVRLCGYIEITLEGLAEVEHSGEPYYPGDADAKQTHAGQIAQPATQAQPLPQGAKPAVAAPTKVALKRIGRIDTAEADTDSNGPDGTPDGTNGGEPMAAPVRAKPAAPAVAAGTAQATPIRKTAPGKTVGAAADTADEPAEATADMPAAVMPTLAAAPAIAPTIAQTPAAASRAARRAALQQKAREGRLFKAEQALAATNADLSVEDETAAEESKSA